MQLQCNIIELVNRIVKTSKCIVQNHLCVKHVTNKITLLAEMLSLPEYGRCKTCMWKQLLDTGVVCSYV